MSPIENPVVVERVALPAEVIQSVSSVLVSDVDDCTKLTAKTTAVTSDDRKLEQTTAATGESGTVPAEEHGDCVSERQFAKLRTEVQRLTDVFRVLDARLYGIIVKLHEQEDNGGLDEKDTVTRVLPGSGDFDQSESQATFTGGVSGLNISPE